MANIWEWNIFSYDNLFKNFFLFFIITNNFFIQKKLYLNFLSTSKLENKSTLINILKRKNKCNVIMIVETWMTNKSENDIKKEIKLHNINEYIMISNNSHR